MKFKVQRKINLANIDKDLWPFETEDIGIEDADSFEEAQKMVDRLVAERIGYYKAQSEEYQKSKLSKASASPYSASAPTPGTLLHQEGSTTGGMPEKFNI